MRDREREGGMRERESERMRGGYRMSWRMSMGWMDGFEMMGNGNVLEMEMEMEMLGNNGMERNGPKGPKETPFESLFYDVKKYPPARV